jgi:hypothetical protein
VDPQVAELNRCLAAFDVTMFKGEDGKHRLWGDINRIQDIVDSDCGKQIPREIRRELDEFFASEVDVRLARCLVNLGVDAVIDPATGVGIEIRGHGPTDQQMDECFKQTYDWFRVPPEDRPSENASSSQSSSPSGPASSDGSATSSTG